MDIVRLHAILADTAFRFRKGRRPLLGSRGRSNPATPETTASTLDVSGYAYESEAQAGLQMIDLELLVVGVDLPAAQRYGAELRALLSRYPQQDRLHAGLSYVEVASHIGDRTRALELLAVGKALGWWDLITPQHLRIQGGSARRLAELGIVMTTRVAFTPPCTRTNRRCEALETIDRCLHCTEHRQRPTAAVA